MLPNFTINLPWLLSPLFFLFISYQIRMWDIGFAGSTAHHTPLRSLDPSPFSHNCMAMHIVHIVYVYIQSVYCNKMYKVLCMFFSGSAMWAFWQTKHACSWICYAFLPPSLLYNVCACVSQYLCIWDKLYEKQPLHATMQRLNAKAEASLCFCFFKPRKGSMWRKPKN